MISRRLIRIKVIQTLYSHFINEADVISVPQKNLIYSLEKCYDLYYMMLTLPCEVARYATEVVDSAKDKLRPTIEDVNPNRRFIDNPIIAQINESKAVNKYMEKHALSWCNNEDMIKSLYNNMVEKEYYKDYMSMNGCSYNDHKNFIANFYKNEIEEFDFLHEEIEDMSIFWADDVEYAASHAMRTISQFSSSAVTAEKYIEVKLLPAYKDSEDLAYAKTLFLKAAAERKKNLEYIESITHNWDIERIALMDKMIMLTAIAEIKYFADIPLNVTFNEYIEISKYYSSQKSSLFINGILDKIIVDMKDKDTLPVTKRS